MKKNKILLGIGIIALGFLPLIITGLLTGRLDNSIARVSSAVSCSILGGCVAEGCGIIYRGINNKANKKHEVEQHDERNIAIRGKAGYISFFVMLFLTLAYSIYIFYILNDRTTGYIGDGIVIVSLLTYIVLYGIFKRKL